MKKACESALSVPDAVAVAAAMAARYRADNPVIGSFRSLWIVSKLDGRWAAQARSSFAA